MCFSLCSCCYLLQRQEPWPKLETHNSEQHTSQLTTKTAPLLIPVRNPGEKNQVRKIKSNCLMFQNKKRQVVQVNINKKCL